MTSKCVAKQCKSVLYFLPNITRYILKHHIIQSSKRQSVRQLCRGPPAVLEKPLKTVNPRVHKLTHTHSLIIHNYQQRIIPRPSRSAVERKQRIRRSEPLARSRSRVHIYIHTIGTAIHTYIRDETTSG